MTRALVCFLNLPRELVEDQGLTVVEYGAQKVALYLPNAVLILTVEKVEHAPVLMEVPSLQDLVKPYCRQYKELCRKLIVTKRRVMV